MPTISLFYGIVIRMYFNDHAPPHFHARYGEDEATIEIDTFSVLAAALPSRALDLVRHGPPRIAQNCSAIGIVAVKTGHHPRSTR